jgi:hypothetical protein
MPARSGNCSIHIQGVTMKIARIRQSAEAAFAVLLISGAGIAFAATPATPAPVAQTPAPAVVTPEPVGPETDAIQSGDQTTPDTGAEATAEAPGTETSGVEEPGDASLPGGGHADDPSNASADTQFEGIQ